MSNALVQEGDVIDYVNAGAAITSGSGVMISANLVGVAEVDIPATTGVGAVVVEGVHSMAKLNTDDFTQGQKVNWNDTTKQWQAATSDADGAGICWAATATGAVLANIKLRSA